MSCVSPCWLEGNKELFSSWDQISVRAYICPILICIKVSWAQGQRTYHSLGQHPHCVTILAKLSLPAAGCVYLKTLATAGRTVTVAPAPRHKPSTQLCLRQWWLVEWRECREGKAAQHQLVYIFWRQISRNRKSLSLTTCYQHHQHLGINELWQSWYKYI